MTTDIQNQRKVKPSKLTTNSEILNSCPAMILNASPACHINRITLGIVANSCCRATICKFNVEPLHPSRKKVTAYQCWMAFNPISQMPFSTHTPILSPQPLYPGTPISYLSKSNQQSSYGAVQVFSLLPR